MRRRRRRWWEFREVVPACLPACLPLVEWNPRIVRDHTGSRRGEGFRALKDG